MYPAPPAWPRQKIPKDGPGPRGVPDCYYTSRVLNSTFRYVKFVRKLRAEEEDQRKGAENKLKELKDKQNSDFFIRCDRRSLINNVARRVDLCMASYQEDLKLKRKTLIDLFKVEEEENIRKFVEQAQAGAEAIWQDKQNRLQYLLEKRKKEHAEKYKDTPLSKCVHVLPCIYKLRAKEAEEIQLYQIKEKEARKMAEKEIDQMWYEVTMKESDALAARMEQDAIERVRRDKECKDYTDYQLEQRRIQREKEKELLRLETQRFKAIWDADIKKEEEAERKRTEKRMATARERKEMIAERHATVARQRAEGKLISDTWDSLAGQGLAQQEAKVQLARKKERENDACNRKMIELKQEIATMDDKNDFMFTQEAARQQLETDLKRCAYQSWAQKTNRDVRVAMVQQIKDRQAAREDQKKIRIEEDEYQSQVQQQLTQLVAHKQMTDAQARKLHQNNLKKQIQYNTLLKIKTVEVQYQSQVHRQLSQLVAHKQMTDAQARKLHQNNLRKQIQYNTLLKERARQEELEEIKKCEIAAEEYQQEIQRMLCRPFFSDEVHPFMKQMAKGLKMQEKCPCSKPDYCK